jgi:hypothetical protein
MKAPLEFGENEVVQMFSRNQLRSRSRRSLALAAVCALATSANAATPVIDHYSSTGDNFYIGTFLPMDSPAAINASFDLMKDLYGTRRIYWRGMQETTYIQGAPRPENVVINKVIGQAKDYLLNQNLNTYAVNAAHSRGMQIWGANQLYDWGVEAKDPIFYGFPGEYEHPLRADHPEWRPVDKYGDRRQGGPVELAYAGARQAMVDWHVNEIAQTGYDGVFFMTYAENFTMRFPDEFGFSDPIVNEYKSRYGVDIRKQSFNKQQWYDLRGEYTTQFLAQLHAALSPSGKKVGMAINAATGATDKPSYWIGQPFSPSGNITHNWQAWAQNHYVDLEMIWGSNPDALGTIQLGTAGTGVETAIMTSEIYYPPLASVLNSGTPVSGAYNMDEDYLLRSNIPVQPLSSLSSSDQYKQMRVLAQIMTGATTATAADVTPLLSHPNMIARRMALRSLGKIGDPSSVPLIEAQLTNSESGIRNAAVYALADKNRPESAQLILDAVALHGNASFMEGAVLVLRNMSTAQTALLNAVQSSTNTEVRSVAMRALAMSSAAITPAMLPTLTTAMNDPEGYVRAYAMDAIGRVSSNNTAVTTLVNATSSNDPIVSNRAAVALKGMLKAFDSAAAARRAEIVGTLDTLFRKSGDGSVRSDKDWGYVMIGNALGELVPDGLVRLRTQMNQRVDRRNSEHAWEILYLKQTPGQFVSINETDDPYQHFKKPRWSTIATMSDSFDLKVNNSQIHNQKDELGQTWQVTQGTSADQVVQSVINNGGKALKAVRRSGGVHEIRISGDSWDAQAAELTTVTAKADWYRPTTGDMTAFGIDIGAGIEAQVMVDANSFYRIWQTDGTANGGSYLTSTVKAGTGGWETLEVVAKWNLATGTTLTGNYDVYVSRDGKSSLGGLGRTLVAANVPIHSVTERTLQQLLISNQPNGALDVTTYWDNVSLKVGAAGLNAFPLKVDLNGGQNTDAHPNNAGFVSWDQLPNNKSGAENLYGSATSITKPFYTAGVTSNAVIATISSVDVNGGTYTNDLPLLNSRDQTVPGREFNSSGSFTPNNDALYRDHVSAEVGTNTVNNGSNHRMELKLDGLDPDTTYQVKVSAYDNANPRSVNVFTDLTVNPSVDLPTGASSDGNFSPGEGASGTQWAPTGQYINGLAAQSFPTTDDFRALTLYLKSDANGRIVLSQTTVTGLSGTTQTLPVLNGFEIAPGKNTWSGSLNTSWNDAGNWLEANVPNGKGRNATFSGAGGTVNIGSAVSAGFVNFTGSSYTITGQTLTLDDNSASSNVTGSATGRAAIHVGYASANQQTITAPVSLAKDTTVHVNSASQTLTLSNLQASSAWLTKTGSGVLAVNNVRTTGLAVSAGTVSILEGRSVNGTSLVGSLSITSGASVNLNDQDLVVDYTGVSPISAIRSAIASAYNGGLWTGTGLTSAYATSLAASPHPAALGFGEAALLGISGSFSGVSFNADAVLVRYTYSGDATLDGKVDTRDFNQLAGAFGSGTTWVQGDFNYTGTVDSTDFGMLLANYGMNMPAASPSLGSLIPEPSMMGLMGVALFTIASRGERKRGQRTK